VSADPKEEAARIPVRVEVDEENRTATVIVPWERLAVLEGDAFREWLRRADAARTEWAKKGYRTN
jgi:hypothetical protein